MDKKFNTLMRTGKTIDMLAEIENLQEVFYHDMQASVSSFDTYEEVSEETRNDLLRVKTVLATFEMLGYIDNAEFNAMLQAASEQRKTVLEGLEGKKRMKQVVKGCMNCKFYHFFDGKCEKLNNKMPPVNLTVPCKNFYYKGGSNDNAKS